MLWIGLLSFFLFFGSLLFLILFLCILLRKSEVNNMLMYCVVCTSEFESKENYFICQSATRVFALLDDAVKYGLDWCRSVWAYPAHADFYIYKFDSSGDLLSEINSLKCSRCKYYSPHDDYTGFCISSCCCDVLPDDDASKCPNFSFKEVIDE